MTAEHEIIVSRRCKHCDKALAHNLLKVERVLFDDSSFRHYEILFELSCDCGSYELVEIIVK